MFTRARVFYQSSYRAGMVLTSIVMFVLFAGTAVAWAGQGVEGHWAGEIQIPGKPLKVDIDFSADKTLTGDISIPAQRAKDLPLSNIVFKEGSITFAIAGIPGNPTFSGAVSGDGERIEGQFSQGGGSFPFYLERTASPQRCQQRH